MATFLNRQYLHIDSRRARCNLFCNPEFASRWYFVDDSTCTGFRIRTAGLISRQAGRTLPAYQGNTAWRTNPCMDPCIYMTVQPSLWCFYRLTMICHRWLIRPRQFASDWTWIHMLTPSWQVSTTRHYGCSPRYVVRSSRYFWVACLRQVQISNIPKSSAENTTFNLTDVNGTKRTVSVPQGITITLDIAGTHYNRKILVGAVESAILTNDS